MKLKESPLRILVKSYANGLLEREKYLVIRQQLLRKLSHQGEITHNDLHKLLKEQDEAENVSWISSYSFSDWIIVALGLLAAGTLGYILYT